MAEQEGQQNDMAQVMAKLRMPEGSSIKRKETFEYVTPGYTYNVELFQNADNTWYTIAVPKDTDRLVVYGSNILPSAQRALQTLIDKIQREGLDQLFGDGVTPGFPEPAEPEDDEEEEETDEDD